MQCQMKAVWEAGWELHEERDGVINKASAACIQCDISSGRLKILKCVIKYFPTQPSSLSTELCKGEKLLSDAV